MLEAGSKFELPSPNPLPPGEEFLLPQGEGGDEGVSSRCSPQMNCCAEEMK